MKLQRWIPPAAAPLYFQDLRHGLGGIFLRQQKLKKLEAEIRTHYGVKHVFLVSSGKAGLALILMALKSLSSRRHVLIPAYTCYSVPSAVVKAGLEISLCDIDPETLDFDFDNLEKSLDESILCVVSTHLLGIPSDIDRVKELCRKTGALIVEDAAQAMGARSHNRLIGNLGDVAFFSAGRGKSITSGSGGIIVTNSDSLANAIRFEYSKLRRQQPWNILSNLFQVLGMYLFMNPLLYWIPAQLPFLELGETRYYSDFPMHRMDGVRGGLLTRWHERLEESSRVRLASAQYYYNDLSACIHLINSRADDRTLYLRLPVMLRNQTEKKHLCALSQKLGLGISPLYPKPIHAIPELKGRVSGREFPGATSVTDMLVTLPVHHFVRTQDRTRICALLRQVHDNVSEGGPFPVRHGLDQQSDPKLASSSK